MNCIYENQQDWYENYLLNRISASEKEVFEQHVQECEICKSNLQAEKQLIGFIRENGQNQMKAEIKRQVQEIKSTQNNRDWTVYFKAAAALLILAFLPGITYYYLNFETPYQTKQIQAFQPKAVSEKEEIVLETSEDAEDVFGGIASSPARAAEAGGKGAAAVKRREAQKATVSSVPASKQMQVEGKSTILPGAGLPEKEASIEIPDLENARMKAAELDVVAEADQAEPLNALEMTDEAVPEEVEQNIVEYHYVASEEIQAMHMKKSVYAEDSPAKLVFKSKGNRIIINNQIIQSDSNFVKYEILEKTISQLNIRWQIFSKEQNLNLKKAKIEIVDQNNLRVIFEKRQLFEIDLQEEKGEVVF